jgi:hypothetical protein
VVTQNTCGPDPAVGTRPSGQITFSEVSAGDGLISDGEQFIFGFGGNQFGPFTFNFPTMIVDHALSSGGSAHWEIDWSNQTFIRVDSKTTDTGAACVIRYG